MCVKADGQRCEQTEHPRGQNEVPAASVSHPELERLAERPELVQRDPDKRVDGDGHRDTLHKVEKYAHEAREGPVGHQVGAHVRARYAQEHKDQVRYGQGQYEKVGHHPDPLKVNDDEEHERIAAHAEHERYRIEQAGYDF